MCEALNHPELAQRSNDDLIRGLEMLRTECEERARLGQEDPWRWFRMAWQPRVLSAACDIPDADAARSRVNGQRSTGRTWTDEMRAEERARADA